MRLINHLPIKTLIISKKNLSNCCERSFLLSQVICKRYFQLYQFVVWIFSMLKYLYICIVLINCAKKSLFVKKRPFIFFVCLAIPSFFMCSKRPKVKNLSYYQRKNTHQQKYLILRSKLHFSAFYYSNINHNLKGMKAKYFKVSFPMDFLKKSL